MKLTNNEIRKLFYSPSIKFYGTMYGGPYGKSEFDRILEINKKNIKFCENADAFYYIWGWPGPDANIYYFKDYGITWAFKEEDFRKEEVESHGTD